jgi:hypoxanthine phosphoribosyltransferase
VEQNTENSPGRRILVVDDNRDSADSLGLLLRVIGHEVTRPVPPPLFPAGKRRRDRPS